MHKTFKTAVLAVSAVFLAGSLAIAAQATPPVAPDAAPPAPQHQVKTGKGKKRSGKKAGRKKNRKKSASTAPR
jgi:hypothetical protein